MNSLDDLNVYLQTKNARPAMIRASVAHNTPARIPAPSSLVEWDR